MSVILNAYRDGIRRVNHAPAILVAMWILTLVVSIPLTMTLRRMVAAHLDSSLTADSVAAGVDYEWMQEFRRDTGGIGATFTPAIIGFAAVLETLSGFIDRVSRPPQVMTTAAVYMATWMLVAAGIIDQYARNEAMRAGRFVRACRTFVFSFSVLGVVQIAAYGLLFGLVHGWLFDRLYPRVTADVAAAPAALFIRLALYAAFGILLAACNLVFDYAKVWLVVEGRRSVLTAIRRTYEFVARHPAIVSGLYLLDTFTFVSLVAFYGAIAPDLGRGWLVWIAFALAQLFIVARIWVKLLFWASEIALFQNGFDGGVLLRSEQCSTIDRSDHAQTRE